MDAKVCLEAIKYIPYSIIHILELFIDYRNDSYAEEEKRVKAVVLPFLYILTIASIIVSIHPLENFVLMIVLWATTIWYFRKTRKCFEFLKQMKIRDCQCGHLLTKNDNFEYDIVEESIIDAVLDMRFVCKRCQTPKNVRCKFELMQIGQATSYVDEKVQKIRPSGTSGEYEVYTDTKRVSAGTHSVIKYQKDVAGVLEDLFSNKACFVKEVEKKEDSAS